MLRYPEVLLLDEPTEGVDRTTAGEMMGCLRRFLPRSTLIVATHDPTLVTEAVTSVARMALGAGAGPGGDAWVGADAVGHRSISRSPTSVSTARG